MAETGLADLLQIMRDRNVGMRDRLNAGVSASRVSAVAHAGEAEPEAITFLRWVISFVGQEGDQFSPSFRREAAAALAFWQRRVARSALQYNVAGVDEKRRQWRSLVNGAIRLHLARIGKWPERKDVLMGPDEALELPAADPEVVLSALMLGSSNRQQRRRQKAIDERAAELWSGSETERAELLRPIARLAHERLQAFGLAD
jgi:hypothetical protein